MQAILLEPGNPNDITKEDLGPLRDSLASASGLDVHIAYHAPTGAGVTLDEVLNFWLPSADFLKDEGYSFLLGGALEYLRRRFKRRGGEKRRKVLIVRDPEGNILRVETIDEENAQVITEEDPDRRDEGRPRPPVQD